MSPEIFLERLANSNAALTVAFDERYYENDKCICFVRDEGETEYVLSMSVDGNGNVKKVEAASTATDKAAAFVSLAENIVRIYSPDEDAETIVAGLFPNGKIPDKCADYDTQWYEYSALADENGFFFSADALALGEHSVPDLTLGDLSGYMNKTG